MTGLSKQIMNGAEPLKFRFDKDPNNRKRQTGRPHGNQAQTHRHCGRRNGR